MLFTGFTGSNFSYIAAQSDILENTAEMAQSNIFENTSDIAQMSHDEISNGLVQINASKTSINAPETAAQAKIHHVFTHALIAHPDIAFAKGNSMAKNYDIDCLTPKEFKKILQSLYERDYMLVDACDIYTVNSSGAHVKALNLPNGKKPLIMSFDDINYYIKKMDMGMADKLIISEGQIATFTKNASPQISYDNDCVPILENFVNTHPDFSHNNARGIINLTGFDGILGYRTHRQSMNRASEIAAAKKVVAALKNRGWKFACHSYGHYHMQKISDAKFASDTDKWLAEVQPLIGKTDLYVYPYGEYELTRKDTRTSYGDNERSQNDTLSPKHRKLLDSGFRFFFGVGGSCYFAPLKSTPSALFMDRVPMDGNTMRRAPKLLKDYFSIASVYDTSRPSKL